MTRFLSKCLALWKSERAEQQEIAERTAIAKAFNDRYCYRIQHEANAPRLSGGAYNGPIPMGGNRWMCPECNLIHAPLECNMFSGLQYPRCCSTSEGNRLNHGIRVS